LCDELGDGVDLGGWSCPRNTGIPPPPFSTCFATVAVLGLSWSGLGPTIA
jgi:hypothetical protein